MPVENSTWRRRIEPYTRPFFFLWSRLTRGKTLGVRGLVTDAEGRVLLIEHTYVPGWWLPGGGVDKGETAQAAVARELREEAGIDPVGEPKLVSVHSNEAFFPGDHVLVFHITDWTACEISSRGEIKGVGFFAPDALPEPMNEASKRRIREVLNGGIPDRLW